MFSVEWPLFRKESSCAFFPHVDPRFFLLLSRSLSQQNVFSVPGETGEQGNVLNHWHAGWPRRARNRRRNPSRRGCLLPLSSAAPTPRMQTLAPGVTSSHVTSSHPRVQSIAPDVTYIVQNVIGVCVRAPARADAWPSCYIHGTLRVLWYMCVCVCVCV